MVSLSAIIGNPCWVDYRNAGFEEHRRRTGNAEDRFGLAIDGGLAGGAPAVILSLRESTQRGQFLPNRQLVIVVHLKQGDSRFAFVRCAGDVRTPSHRK